MKARRHSPEQIIRTLREADILSYLTFPSEHWRSIRSTNALVRMSSQKGTTVIAQKGTTWERKRSQQ
jgi:transposase-like protein